MELGRYTEALADFDKAIVLSPMDNADAYTDRGYLYALLDRLDDAILDYNRAIEQADSFGLAYFRRGLAHSALREYDEALQDFGKAIELGIEGAEVFLQRGTVYEKLEEYDAAVSDYRKYLELEPTALDREEVEQRIEGLTGSIQ